MLIKNIIEKPDLKNAPSDLAVVGRYILNHDIFKYLEQVKEDKSNEIQLTDAIKLMLEDQNILACEYTGDKFDCGSKSGYVEATMFMALRDKDIKLDLQKYLNFKF
jgi:UTP--glucose-1-phosphate uridylyltransferase